MTKNDDGTWVAFVPDVADGTHYRFYVVGEAGGGFKRDPWARELHMSQTFPYVDCLVRRPDTWPWHDAAFRPPAFHEMIIYQLHVGTFHRVDGSGKDVRSSMVGRFVDLIERIPYLKELGINAVQLLPVQEFPFSRNLGYSNTDFFSPEMAYQIEDSPELDRFLTVINEELARHGQPTVAREQIVPGPNQLKALIDLLHLNGIGIILDQVYNHAGGDLSKDPESLYFFDRKNPGNDNDSLYFTDQGWAGGKVFAYWNANVRDFLIQNAKFFLDEFHADGFRFDEISVVDRFGGWHFCQDMTRTLHYVKPSAIQIAEYWTDSRHLAVKAVPEGMGFDAALDDRLRDSLRAALGAASGGRDAHVDLDRVRAALYNPFGLNDAWRSVTCIENQDIVYDREDPEEWKPRIAKLADFSNPRSWYARSRTRWATAMLLTSPGIPTLFMGQEILEDKNWHDSPEWHPAALIWWDGLLADTAMSDFLAFVKSVIRLRREYAALCGPCVNGYHVNNGARVLAFHRWLDGAGQDVVVLASLNESNLYGYDIGIPGSGRWREVFNSDFFESAPGHSTAGNGGVVEASGGPMHGLPASARVTLPANGVIVLAR